MRWSYKTVRFGLKKEGLLGSAYLDESEIEFSLNEFGKSGWELVSFMEVLDGLIGVFKQPLSHGLARIDREPTEEEIAVSESFHEPPSAFRESTSVFSEDEGQAREQRLKKGLDPNEAEPDDTDVGSIRIE
ncbi:MAG: DUF4177 domain-containing protein [Proteobacteria bacterium]|nr:DUF4177 domain-containing protein [Pseudomonadota bacterium]MBU1232565.1 DUF4177 domain-containing protein [Pseudomonadota bacterium]MBU1420672.1 DUF4177 domain-containing protein [Pseudomonadota bacterium]MBU1454324.1 DUF4177 domain-containing protein [Pseudomonadota bacterium]